MLGVVIVSYYSSKYLQHCLESLRGEASWEQICVVDNAQDDSLVELLSHFPGIHLLRNASNRGFSAAANQGIALFLEKNAEAILLLNPDTIVKKGAIQEMMKILKAGAKRMIVQPLITLMKDNKKINTWGNEYKGFGLVSLGGYRKSIPVDLVDRQIEYASGACMLIDVEAFKKFGMLDERFFLYFEDTEFSQRIRQSGGEVWLSARARVEHDHAFPLSHKKIMHFLRSWWRFSSMI